MSHLTKTMIGVAAVACLTLSGCGTSGWFSSSKSATNSQGMSQYNMQRQAEWKQNNINDEWWDSKVVFHPEFITSTRRAPFPATEKGIRVRVRCAGTRVASSSDASRRNWVSSCSSVERARHLVQGRSQRV